MLRWRASCWFNVRRTRVGELSGFATPLVFVVLRVVCTVRVFGSLEKKHANIQTVHWLKSTRAWINEWNTYSKPSSIPTFDRWVSVGGILQVQSSCLGIVVLVVVVMIVVSAHLCHVSNHRANCPIDWRWLIDCVNQWCRRQLFGSSWSIHTMSSCALRHLASEINETSTKCIKQ